MTKPKSVFKTRKYKGNQHFRTYSVVEPNSQTEQCTESRPNSSTPSSSKKKLSVTEYKYSVIENSDSVNIINLDILSSVISEIASCNLCGWQIILSENIEKRNTALTCG